VVQALEGLEGVKRANASHPEKKAVVVYDKALVTLEQMQKVLFKAGYVASFGNHKKEGILGPISERKSEYQSVDLVCFCFEYTRKDIERDYIENKNSTILAKIAAEKKAGSCNCATKNPKGR
jgi:hypothetical protein